MSRSPPAKAAILIVSFAVVIGALFTTYQSVTMAWADVERLAQVQADAERQLREAETPGSPPLKQAPQSASSAAHAQNLTPAEMRAAGGKKSGETRRAARKWVPHATELAKAACSRNPTAVANARGVASQRTLRIGHRAGVAAPRYAAYAFEAGRSRQTESGPYASAANRFASRDTKRFRWALARNTSVHLEDCMRRARHGLRRPEEAVKCQTPNRARSAAR